MPLSRGGSAVTNVVRALAREQRAAWGSAPYVVISDNRDGADVEHATNLPVDYTRACPREYFTATEYAVDHARGALGRERRHGPAPFAVAADALTEIEPDTVVLHEGHYAVTALPLLRRRLGPDVRLVLWVHTHLSRAIRVRELRRLLAHADHVVCVSTAMATHVRGRCGGRVPTPVSVVLNGTLP